MTSNCVINSCIFGYFPKMCDFPSKRERNLALIGIAPKKDGENLDVAWGIVYLWFMVDRVDLAAS